MNVFGFATEDFTEPLQRATQRFRQWMREKKIHSSQRPFKPSQLHRKGYGYFLNAKGFNARLVSEFLMEMLIEVNGHGNRFPHLVHDERAVVAEGALNPGPFVHIFLLTVPYFRSLSYNRQTLSVALPKTAQEGHKPLLRAL